MKWSQIINILIPNITDQYTLNILSKLWEWEIETRSTLSYIENQLNQINDWKTKNNFKELWNKNIYSIYEIIESWENIVFKVKSDQNINFNKKLWGELHIRDYNGDEWNDMATFDEVEYNQWKTWLINTFIYPYVNKNKTILEIAVWHWRRTKYLLWWSYEKYIWIDIAENCIEYCKKTFNNYENIDFLLWNWNDLSMINSNSIDFIFSFDSFVHIDQNIFQNYIKEFNRILKKWWIAIIHHSNTTNKNQIQSTWYRASCNNQTISEHIIKNNLTIIKQISKRWDKNQYSVDKFNDIITLISK